MVRLCACDRDQCSAESHADKAHCTKQVGPKSAPLSMCKACEHQVFDAWVTRTEAISAPLKHFRSQHVLQEGLAKAQEVKKGASSKRPRYSFPPSLDQTAKASPVIAVSTSSASQLVHHLWIDLPGAVGPSASLSLPALAQRCLRAWEPCEQWLWVFGPVHADEHIQIQNLHIQDASAVLPAGMCLSMLAGQVPVQIVKDIFSMKVLHIHGGTWADLDILWLGKPLPIPKCGYLFSLEPHVKCEGHFLARTHDRVTLALLSMPKHSPQALALYHQMLSKWKAFAIQHFEAGAKVVDWECSSMSSLWMWNTDQLTTSALHLVDKHGPDIVLKPHVLCPLPMRLTASEWIAVDTTVSSMSSAPVSSGATDFTLPYEVPSAADMALHSVTVNLWSRQWHPGVQQSVLDRGLAIRVDQELPQVNGINPSLAPALQVADHIEAVAGTVMQCIGFCHGHGLLARAHKAVQQPWLTALILHNGRNVVARARGDCGVPGLFTGWGPWLGPQISAELWACLILKTAIKPQFHESGPDPDQVTKLHELLAGAFLPQENEATLSIADVSPWFCAIRSLDQSR